MYFDARDVAANSTSWYSSINSKAMTITIEVIIDDDTFKNLKETLSLEAFNLIDKDSGCVTLPMKYIVCPLCYGKGKHVNPSIDSHGITASEWNEWDQEERDLYINGGYDVICYQCNGERVIPEINESLLSNSEKEIVKIIEENRNSERMFNNMCMMERMMGA